MHSTNFTPIYSRCAGLLLALLCTACTAPKVIEVPTPETDPVLARNLAAMAEPRSVLDLAWRQPTETVVGTDAALPAVAGSAFPAPEALAQAQAYSEAHDGHGLLVWHDGDLVYSRFDEGLSATTPFTAFSMHKSVLALMLLAAVEDGIVGSLDDAVGGYIPEWAGDARGKITLRQLLQQVSGLAYFAFNSGDPRPAAISLSSRVSDTALSYPLDKVPGSEFNYSNVNSQILGIALENALAEKGLRYADYLSSRLWQPLGNNNAQLWLEAEGGSPRYYAGLTAGLADWLRVGVMLINQGRVGERQVLRQESVAQLSAPSPRNASYSLNTWLGGDWQPKRLYGPYTPSGVLHGEPYLAPDVLFFDGFGGQRLYVVPSQNLVIARFGEVDMAYDDAAIVNTLLRGLVDAQQP